MTGQTVSHYRVLEKLGAGGMGVVYKVQDLKLDRLVALKFLPPHLSADPQQKQRFVQEAKAACALDHANIGVVHDIDETGDGQMFIVMAYYDGETLARRIARGVSTGEAIDIAIQISKALQTAHEHGMVHRDIKPGNVLLTPDGVVKVIDFGLARVADVTATLEGTTQGTIAYMSPEQVRGEQVDRRADIWAAGVVLYEMLAKHRPFEGEHASIVMRSILETEPKELRAFRPDVPGALAQIVRRALAKDRKARYASAGEMLRDLKALEAGGPARLHRWVAPTAAALIPIALLAWYAVHEYRIQWARDTAIPQIEHDIADDNYLAAVDLAREAQKRVPNDAKLAALWPQMSSKLSIVTDPPGAEVSFKRYGAPESEWRHLGVGPLTNAVAPRGFLEWKVSKEGYADNHFTFVTPGSGLPPAALLAMNGLFRLLPQARVPAGMVRVPGGNLINNLASFGVIGPVAVPDYFIDRYEVTNREFKQFVDRGGYQSREYWKEPFRDGNRSVSWEEAMSRFHDSTGRPGPATWEGGAFREGEEDFPVSGVSWYEASAYAEFAGKKIPTAIHWYRAAIGSTTSQIEPHILPASNFAKKGVARVGQYAGMSPFGAYDMAGNVKEWCSNETGTGLRFSLGGAWNEPSYQFSDPDARSPFDRSATHGFRCVRYSAPLSAALAAPMQPLFRDYSKEKPASDDLFRVYQRYYSYEPSDLKSTVDAVNDTSPYWRIEKVSFQTAYGNQRMAAYLYLPKNVPPPYNPVVLFPSLDALLTHSSSNLEKGPRGLDFVIRSGRAFLIPVIYGSYERSTPGAPPIGQTPLQRRDQILRWVQDVRRSVHYLATRQDMDLSRLTYYGTSLGGWAGTLILAIEPRFKVAVLSDGGFSFIRGLPECDSINFVTRIEIPVLMVNGRYDYTFPLATSQDPLFRLLGTPEKDKRHFLFEGGHGAGLAAHRSEYVREVLGWLDRYAPVGKK